jgi:hypothetical protein
MVMDVLLVSMGRVHTTGREGGLDTHGAWQGSYQVTPADRSVRVRPPAVQADSSAARHKASHTPGQTHRREPDTLIIS